MIVHLLSIVKNRLLQLSSVKNGDGQKESVLRLIYIGHINICRYESRDGQWEDSVQK